MTRTTHAKKAVRAATVTALLALVGVFLVWWSDRTDDEDGRGNARTRSADGLTEGLFAATAARIAREGRIPVPLAASAPPPQQDASRPLDDRDRTPTPPDGYSFVSVRDAGMAKAAIRRRSDVPPPPDGHPDWLQSSTPARTLAANAAATGRGWSFAWLRLSPDAQPDDLAGPLADAGAEVVGASGYLLRVRLRADEARLRRIADVPGVAAVATMPAHAKLHGLAAQRTERAGPTPVFVTLMADDADGRWGRELAALGAVVGRYDAPIRVYSANVTPDVLQALARADFVLAVEPVRTVEPSHDTSIPAMGADALRTWAGPGLFDGVGGASVPVGVMDTGLNIRHADIRERRTSICGANFVSYQAREQDADLWVDRRGHGTHVTGTFIGNGFGSGAFAGMAPSVRHVRFAKVLHSAGLATNDDTHRGLDWIATATACDGSDPVRPLVVNMSLGTTGSYHAGRDVGGRKLDAAAWDRRQLYVVAQANSARSGFSNFGAAKNSLAVGATHDSGDIAAFSSHGPTADGRLAPHVVAPGARVYSTLGNGAPAGYERRWGTSTASPTVAGTAALLMDAVPAHAGEPALVRARLMASAVRPDAWLDAPDAFPSDNSNGPGRLQARYGLGKASARTAVLERDAPDGWTGGGATVSIADGATYAYEDVRVPRGAKRLDVVLAWDEPPVDPVAQSVLNDLDLWLDAGADCGDGACGERSSTSAVDNVEWVIVKDPAPGVWRLKVVGRRVHTASRAALAWTVVRGASTPALAVAAGTPAARPAAEGSRVGFGVSVTADAYVAAGTTLHFECRGDAADCAGVRIVAQDVAREDGLATAAGELGSATGSQVPLGRRIGLGEIAVGETRTVDVEVAWPETGPVELHYTASAWNASGASGSLLLRPGGSGAQSGSARLRANDDFARPAAIRGPEGSTEVDLAGATPQPGEPPASALDGVGDPRWVERPLGSLWYRWTAPDDGLATFWLAADGTLGSETVAVFEGEAPATLVAVASNQWIERQTIYEDGARSRITETVRTAGSAAFFATRGTRYRVRVANREPSAAPLTLRWHQGDGPANDDFDAAHDLAGAAGEFRGTNAGATLEAGESLGGLAATTWHRWTAPDDGAWTFGVDAANLRVAAFTGDAVRDLRLVSGFPDSTASLRARSGQVYRIAVAAADAFGADVPYTLAWETADRKPAESDDFEDRKPFAGAAGAMDWTIGTSETVQPGEPPETGVRTAWWSWTAPADGDWTWRLEAPTTAGPAMAAFAGGRIGSLRLAGTTAGRVNAREFSFRAVAGTAYAFSIGWPAGDLGAYAVESSAGRVSWGPTPRNDQRAGATALAGTRGSTGADDAYATAAPGEHDDLLGRASLWWRWEAPTDGWYAFAAPGRHLAVYEAGADAPAARQRTVAGRVTFRAEAGRTYAVRAGTPVAADDGAYRLTWAPADAPAWLRYHGAVADGAGDAALPLANPASLAADDGDRLFAVSNHGLEVFRRDADDGALTALRTIDADLVGSLLAWDGRRARLLANRCGDWFAFERAAAAVAATDVAVSDDPANCGVKLLTTPDGTSVYRAGTAGIDRFRVDAGGGLRYVDTTAVSSDVRDAVLAADGRRLYAFAHPPGNPGGATLRSFARTVADGALSPAGEANLAGERSLAIDGDGERLFAADARASADIYELPTLRHVGKVDYDNLLFRDWQHAPYRFAVARGSAGTADVFGAGAALSLVAGTGLTDALAGTDRFRNPLPLFGVPNDVVASADARHVYASTARHGILVFERVGAGVEPIDAHVVSDVLGVSSGAVSFAGTDGTGCLAGDGVEHDGVVYTVLSAKWQRRSNADWPWADVAGTASSGELCPHTPSEAGHYRLVAVVEVDGKRQRLASNTLVRNDHGDAAGDATPVGIPSTTAGWLDPDEADHFRVDLAGVGTLTVYTEGWTDTSGSLLDDAGDAVARDGDSGTDRNFRISRRLAAGAYVVRVRGPDGAPGAYTLHVEGEFRDGPDLVVASAEIAERPAPGETFTLGVVVRNDGNATAPATVLRYYRSDDGAISTADDEVGTAQVGALAAGASAEHSTDLVAPDDGGPYSYGACVDAVDGELDPANNCSARARAAGGSGVHLDFVFQLAAENARPTGIAHAHGTLYVPDGSSRTVHAYTTAGVHRPEAAFDLNAHGGHAAPNDLTHADGLLYALSYTGEATPERVFVYTTSGEHRATAGFELAEGQVLAQRITHAEGLLYVLARFSSNKVFVYTTAGVHRADAGFALAEYRDGAIAHADDGLLYVANGSVTGNYPRTVHAYTTAGERRPGDDFEIDARQVSIAGMTYADGSFYVVDWGTLRVYVYRRD